MLCTACRTGLAASPSIGSFTRVHQCLSVAGPSRPSITVRRYNNPPRASGFGLRQDRQDDPPLSRMSEASVGYAERAYAAEDTGDRRFTSTSTQHQMEGGPRPPRRRRNAPLPLPVDPIQKTYSKKSYMGRHFNPKPVPDWLFAEDLRGVLSQDPLNPGDLLRAVHPALEGSRQIVLDKHLQDISSILADAYGRSINTAGLQNDVSNIFSVCFVRAFNAIGGGKKTVAAAIGKGRAEQVFESVSRDFATYLVHQTILAQDLGRLQALFGVLDVSLTQYSKRSRSEQRLSVPMTAALAILRSRLDIAGRPKLEYVWPDGDSVSHFLLDIGVDSDQYRKNIDELVKGRPSHGLPSTPTELEAKLGEFVRTGREAEVLALWHKFSEAIDPDHPHPITPGDVLDPACRNEVLIAFVRALRSPLYGELPPVDRDQLESATQAAISCFSRPIPAPVYHTMLAFRSRLDPSEDSTAKPAGAQVTLLNETLGQSRYERRQELLDSLHSTWESAKKDGVVKDVKMYSLYISGLARFGDLEGLQQAWNELVTDADCRRAYQVEEGDPNAPYPPTKLLNHMIAVTLLVPKVGPPLALGLFEQTLQPDSSIRPNIVTINTVLRHHARMADVPAMQSIFTLTEELGLEPDTVTFTTLLQGLLRAKEWDIVYNTLDVMVTQGHEPSERMCSVLIADLAHDGERLGLQHAEELLREMIRVGWKPGVATWTALISGYFRGGWEQDGWDAVRRMEGARVKLNRVAFNMIMREAGRADIRPGTDSAAYKLFQEMIRDGHWPNGDTYEIVLRPLVNTRRWVEANEVINEMEKRNYVPEGGSLKALVLRARTIRAREPLR